jgi:DNA repair protein SbcC/Rad50
MRPLSLTIEGMTAFRDPQVVDLRDLGLFCVTGATGAGKTTIFDALSFALYGKVHRVTNRVRSMIATGRPEAVVKLDFTVSGDRYRITRRITQGGARGGGRHDARLEKRDGTTWVGVQSGAEPVSLAIEELTGLDFHAFTSAAMLPQGEFARFLMGDAKDRRAILVRLLDLSRVERAGSRARVLKETIEREAAALGPDAIAHAATQAAEAKTRADACAGAAEQARRATEQATSGAEAAKRLGRVAARFEDLGARHTALEDQRVLVAPRAQAAAAELAAAEAALAAATAQKDSALREHAALTTSVGTAADLALLVEAQRVRQGALVEAEQAAHAIVTTQKNCDELDAALARCTQALAAARTDAEGAQKELERKTAQAVSDAAAVHTRAGDELRALEREHAAAGLRGHIENGDPCPVCARTIEGDLPTVPEDLGERLEAARRQLAETEVLLGTAGAPPADTIAMAQTALLALEQARVQKSETESALKVAASQLDALRRSHEAAAGRAGEAESRLTGALGVPLPDDVETQLAQRRAALTSAESAAVRAGEGVTKAQAALDAARHAGTDVGADHARIEASLTALTEELRSLATDLSDAITDAGMSAIDLPDDESLGGRIATLTATAQRHADDAAKDAQHRAQTVAEQLSAVGITPDDAERPADALEEAARVAAAEYARLVEQVASLERQREQLAARAKHADALGSEAAGLETLANHLKSDRFLEFLLSEYVDEIVALASSRLTEISAGRYSLHADQGSGGAFHVIDRHNADERRGVNTLSGGETFQASLALALALSEGLANLSGDRRLDAVFIDEGFASLDAESLDLAIDALESVHAGGRMVGVITHVPQMAERIPEGLDVLKGEAGSTIVRRAA